MESDDLLRLAWEADHDGRRTLRDALLTLAVAESGPADTWAEAARVRLIARRPDHFLAGFATVDLAVRNSRITEWATRARIKYPAGRIRWMLLRSQATRGTYTGRVESIQAILDDLLGVPAEAENVRLDAAQRVRGPIARARSRRAVAVRSGPSAVSSWDDAEVDDPSQVVNFYMTVLLAIAILLTIVQREPAKS